MDSTEFVEHKISLPPGKERRNTAVIRQPRYFCLLFLLRPYLTLTGIVHVKKRKTENALQRTSSLNFHRVSITLVIYITTDKNFLFTFGQSKLIFLEPERKLHAVSLFLDPRKSETREAE